MTLSTPLDIQLHDRVLVGHAQRLFRRLPECTRLRGDRRVSQARPRLAEPIRHVAQRVRVRHHHLDVFALGLVHQICNAAPVRAVFPSFLDFWQSRSFPPRPEAVVDVDARDCRAEQADGLSTEKRRPRRGIGNEA